MDEILGGLVADKNLRQELLDRFDELKDSTGAQGLGGLESSRPITVDRANDTINDLLEGTHVAQNDGLEAIIKRFTRPVMFVEDADWTNPRDDFPNSAEIATLLTAAKPKVSPSLRSVGRIDLSNADKLWCGTGWVVDPNIVVTNRHVAANFAEKTENGFEFFEDFSGRRVKASLDWRREYRVGAESLFRVEEVLWIEPRGAGRPDIAILRIRSRGEDDEPQPGPIKLVDADDAEEMTVDRWTAVVGYPARDSRQDAEDQQRIFDGVYDVKRLAPGKVTAIMPDGRMKHDATTLGGNSGSAIIDLETGRAVGLHYGGKAGLANYAVGGPLVKKILDRVLG